MGDKVIAISAPPYYVVVVDKKTTTTRAKTKTKMTSRIKWLTTAISSSF